MQTRTMLLLVLFLVMSLFYGTVLWSNVPDVEEKIKAQQEVLSNLQDRDFSEPLSES